jgi:hypothetical protein
MRGALFALLVACAGPPAPEGPALRTFTAAELGVALDLPVDWVVEARGTGHVLSGPAGTDAFYTTVALQPVERTQGDALDVALERIYAPVLAVRGFAWERREPTTVSGKPALFYSVRFEHHETPRRKACVLVDADGWYLDVCYSATEALFPSGVAIFSDAVDSLTL